jgi:chromate transporter
LIYLELFTGFLTVGLFSFGGAYAAIPLIRDVVLSYGWLDEDTLTNMIAIGESTPGPIMVNLATYIGSSQAGVTGGIIATFAVVMPAFFIILLIMILLRKMLDNEYVQAILYGLKPCITGIIVATGCYMILRDCIIPLNQQSADLKPAFITMILAMLYFGSRKVLNKKMSPIMLIVVSAVLGVVMYGI